MANGIYPNPMANANAIGQLIGGGIGLYSNYQQQQAAKERQAALAQQQVQALNLLGQSQSLIQSNPDEARNLFLQAYQLAPEFVNKAMAGLQSQQKLTGAGDPVDMTSTQKNYQQYVELKKTDPAAAVEFGRASGFVDKAGNELSVHLQKRLSQSTDSAIEARSNAQQISGLASEIEKAGFGGGLFGGSWGEALKEYSGNQDAETELRRRYYAIRGSQVVKNLPPGAASDTDIKLALAGFPADTAGAKEISSFLNGVAKLEEATADFNEFQAQYISDNGSEKGMLAAWKKQSASEAGDSVVFTSEQYGDVTEADIQETMKANNISREEVLRRLGAK